MEQKLIDSSLLKKLESLKLNSNVVLNQGYGGGRKSKSKGSSVEFSDFREYVPGDDFRKIDWNAYGRFQKLFIKLFMEEREANINIFIDASKSMDFGNPKKSTLAKQLALVFGYLSLANMDRVNIYIHGNNKLESLEQLSGKNNAHRLATYLDNIIFDKSEDFFQIIKTQAYKRGISIILSDLFSDNFQAAIKYLSFMNQSIVVLNLLSVEEITPFYSGDIRFIDSETEEGKDISMTQSVLNSYDKTFKNFINRNREICRKFSCQYTLISNELSIESIVFDNLTNVGILR
ncbi:DUF58 domain-containing protein [Proteiniborus sp. MB09-C3]|uniref:DUF58 domain-containing protein n=1 Tax=Proteiniborus sp. MB09-C3 TaxID=3050072 RepID=UPI002556FA42|nr:DUF58 domain-containing protein [Proteiniborus sp. MB09-C3]WIV11507.1 DUF58 domain-containing protein [Proteiniborus sp. MB09-C3]